MIGVNFSEILIKGKQIWFDLAGNSNPSSSYRGSTVLNPPESDRVLAYSRRIPSTICNNDYSYVSSKQKETIKWFSMHLEVSCSYRNDL